MRDWVAKVLVALVVFSLLPGVSHADHPSNALRMMKGVCVLTDSNPETERLGLSRNQLQTDVELRLRKAGIKIISGLVGPNLVVVVTTIARSGLCAYLVQVELKDMVTVERDKDFPFFLFCSLWQTNIIGMTEPGNINEIRSTVGDQVDKFINDYLTANPKK